MFTIFFWFYVPAGYSVSNEFSDPVKVKLHALRCTSPIDRLQSISNELSDPNGFRTLPTINVFSNVMITRDSGKTKLESILDNRVCAEINCIFKTTQKRLLFNFVFFFVIITVLTSFQLTIYVTCKRFIQKYNISGFFTTDRVKKCVDGRGQENYKKHVSYTDMTVLD